MKQAMFERMINNPPQDTTHYRRFRDYVVFYTNIDNTTFGSYENQYWFADEAYPEGVWFTKRERLDLNKAVKL